VITHLTKCLCPAVLRQVVVDFCREHLDRERQHLAQPPRALIINDAEVRGPNLCALQPQLALLPLQGRTEARNRSTDTHHEWGLPRVCVGCAWAGKSCGRALGAGWVRRDHWRHWRTPVDGGPWLHALHGVLL